MHQAPQFNQIHDSTVVLAMLRVKLFPVRVKTGKSTEMNANLIVAHPKLVAVLFPTCASYFLSLGVLTPFVIALNTILRPDKSAWRGCGSMVATSCAWITRRFNKRNNTATCRSAFSYCRGKAWMLFRRFLRRPQGACVRNPDADPLLDELGQEDGSGVKGKTAFFAGCIDLVRFEHFDKSCTLSLSLCLCLFFRCRAIDLLPSQERTGVPMEPIFPMFFHG